MEIKEFVQSSIDEYIDKSDWRVRANANQGFSLGGLILNTSGKVMANYWLNEVYPKEVGEAHRSGDIHIHDLDMLSGYCAGWSLRDLLAEGFNGVHGKIEAGKAEHFRSALGQIVNFFGTLQNEWAGAQAFSSFDTLLAPYVHKDKLSYKEVKQAIQEFVFNLNVPSRWGTQTPFTNLTFDLVCPEDLVDKFPAIYEGLSYKDFQSEMDMINKAFCEVMCEGDSLGRVFTYPIPTYNITKDFEWDSEVAASIFAMTAKYGTPYFQNFINSRLEPGQVRSMCCRLQLDLTQLLDKGNGLFGSAEMTGSIGVVTVNLARLGYLSKNIEELLDSLEKIFVISKESLEIKRAKLNEFLNRGLYPFTKRYLRSFHRHFSTIGINGMNECLLNLIGKDITTAEGQETASKILDVCNDLIRKFQQETGNLYNLEATPAEGATYRFAREDKKRFKGIIQAGEGDATYYSNSSQLPVGFTDDPWQALELQENLQTAYTGGTVLHFFLSEKLPSGKLAAEFVKRVFSNSRIPYMTLTPTFSICKEHGYLSGEVPKCPYCGQDTEVWSRVMGYHRPISEWNTGKQREHAERKPFSIKKGDNNV